MKIFAGNEKIKLWIFNSPPKLQVLTNKEKYIYVSSTEGVYVIDAENKTVKERYEYFYDPNDKVNVSFINFSKNKIYAISNGDIFFSDINSNYKDFRNWYKMSLFNDSIYGSFIENDQLYFYNNNSIFSEIGVSVGTDVDGEIVELKATMEKQGHGLTMTEAMKYEKNENSRQPF